MDPIKRAFTVSELIKAVVPVKLKVEILDVFKLDGIPAIPPDPMFAKATPLMDAKKVCCVELLVEYIPPAYTTSEDTLVAITSPIFTNP